MSQLAQFVLLVVSALTSHNSCPIHSEPMTSCIESNLQYSAVVVDMGGDYQFVIPLVVTVA